MSRLQTWMKLVFPVAGLLLLAVTVAWPDAAASPARNPELTPRAYLPLVVNCHPFSPDICCEPDDQPSQACHIPPGVYQAHISSPYDQDWYTFILDGESQVTLSGCACRGATTTTCISTAIPRVHQLLIPPLRGMPRKPSPSRFPPALTTSSSFPRRRNRSCPTS